MSMSVCTASILVFGLVTSTFRRFANFTYQEMCLPQIIPRDLSFLDNCLLGLRIDLSES